MTCCTTRKSVSNMISSALMHRAEASVVVLVVADSPWMTSSVRSETSSVVTVVSVVSVALVVADDISGRNIGALICDCVLS